LRSLAVASTERSAGIGNALVNFIEDHAKEKGLKEIVLLTTTAAAYFDKRSYTSIERTNIPEAIKQSAEFRSTCPASATTMLKTL
jgi:amino-acid N-acetyltransferase